MTAYLGKWAVLLPERLKVRSSEKCLRAQRISQRRLRRLGREHGVMGMHGDGGENQDGFVGKLLGSSLPIYGKSLGEYCSNFSSSLSLCLNAKRVEPPVNFNLKEWASRVSEAIPLRAGVADHTAIVSEWFLQLCWIFLIIISGKSCSIWPGRQQLRWCLSSQQHAS